ncbi:protein trichome birefringence-like 6 [Andrographis paniculata]|uniref:protein trichome birefringence-like 6 n=1 Tax=Andrographis paniculata TaxID=175694 RepID=UPI0021E843C6|nr:protein trichome birefringence-like 6 [Andrographis paniculata]XP_051141804.1 protein trichome birefringence-like 6 [Andrographis paniculata]XP_051141805.1 protein trichome birefringence-like 6 [Andrographis paniculata]
MEKQRSFSAKPPPIVRFVVFSFTIFFSLLFLIFFSTSIIPAAPPPLDLDLDSDLGFNTTATTTDVTAPSLNREDSTPSQYLLNNSNLFGSSSQRDVISSRIPANSGLPQREREREREITITMPTVEGSTMLTGNPNLTSFGKNLSIFKLSSSQLDVDDTNSTHNGFQENSSNKYVTNNSKAVLDDGISFEKPRHVTSIQKKVESKHGPGCDITRGRWVRDESNPFYTNAQCPFIDEGFNCEANGRRDKQYMKWRWQPQDCEIPRFNATKMLEHLRGKRLVFVGDSINRNQWESMLCLLMGGIEDPKKVYEIHGRRITKGRGNYCFKFEEYKCKVEYYVSHFLVHESKAHVGSKRVQTLRIDTIDKGSSRWRGADILVFNTAHWWSHHKTKAGVNYYQEGDKVHPQLDVTEAFRRSLLTWASWVDKHINPRKTQIFFRSSAPSHFSGGLWNTGGHCKEAFWPVNETFGPTYPLTKNLMVEEVIRQMKTPVTFLDITQLSNYRPDAHPSIYGRRSVNPGVQDCSHWCLPGVPDTWNELLYHNLLFRTGNT